MLTEVSTSIMLSCSYGIMESGLSEEAAVLNKVIGANAGGLRYLLFTLSVKTSALTNA
jgi:hypothetical protein